jgi:hypothetical protein
METVEVILFVDQEDYPFSSLGTGLGPGDVRGLPVDVCLNGSKEVGGRNCSFVQDWGKVYPADFWCMSGRRCGGGVEPPDIFVGIIFSPASIVV